MKKILSFALVLMTVLALMIPAFASAEEAGGMTGGTDTPHGFGKLEDCGCPM